MWPRRRSRGGLAAILALLTTLLVPVFPAAACEAGLAPATVTVVETHGQPVRVTAGQDAITLDSVDEPASITQTFVVLCDLPGAAGSPHLRFRGGGTTELAGSIWPDGLSLNADAKITVAGGLTSDGIFELRAPAIQIDGSLAAPAISLSSDGPLTLNGAITSPGGRVDLAADLLMLGAPVSADGPAGGAIRIAADRLVQWQPVTARGNVGPGGEIALEVRSRTVQTVDGGLDASGSSGGHIIVRSAEAGRFYSSGALAATGTTGPGGTIQVVAGTVVLAAAGAKVSGKTGGEVRFAAGELEASAAARIAADARGGGNGGLVTLQAERSLTPAGEISARGGFSGGNGGSVRFLTAGELRTPGSVDVSAAVGWAGSVLMDPKNLSVSLSGIYPQYNFINPSGTSGNKFGDGVLTLSTGNVVVTAPSDDTAAVNAGAVYMFDGLTGALKSVLTGSQMDDQVGLVATALTNGNFVVLSQKWKNGMFANAGAATWASGVSGISGAVTPGNSLVGSQANDTVGAGVTALSKGNYVVTSAVWSNGAVERVGAVTWSSGVTGITGPVSTTNSLVGTQPGDFVGLGGIVELTNGNYVVHSNNWRNGANGSAGAVTWVDGTTGTTGVVTTTNSLVGSKLNDHVGDDGVIALPNGNYVVTSLNWDNGAALDAGAVTWGSGTPGVTGVVTLTNSLVGSRTDDRVGHGGITILTSGNYVVQSSDWDNGPRVDAGAVTWGSADSGVAGVVTGTNSLVGTSVADAVGSAGVTALANGNYVVASPDWNNGGIGDVGAITWGNGLSGITGAVTSTNSLIGPHANDGVGQRGVTALTNGNYVVSSNTWGNGAAFNLGAVTWVNGTTSITGVVTTTNSLVGSQLSDFVGQGGVAALTNGNYVVSSPFWNNGPITRTGAATLGNGTFGTTGTVTSSNSLVGTQANDLVGFSVTALTNDNYVVGSPFWKNGAIVDAGAATWSSGVTGIAGAVSGSNSLVGDQPNDKVSLNAITGLPNGNYLVRSNSWSNGVNTAVGAVTWGSGATGVSGPVTTTNSLVGSHASDVVGFEAIVVLPNSSFIVPASFWNNGLNGDAGAVTLGQGASGVTGEVSAANSIVGTAATAGLQTVITDSINGTFLARFRDEGPGRVTAGLQDPNQLTFLRASAQSPTILPSFLERTLTAGTAVTIEASNDLTLDAPLAPANPAGAAGALTGRAGRSLLLNGGITSDDGAISLLANEPLGSGVVDSQRDPGDAGLTFAPGVTLNAGSGSVTLRLGEWAGKTNHGIGTLSFGAITAPSITISSAGNAILQAGATVQSALTISTVSGLTVQTGAVLGGTGTIAGPVTIENGATLSPGLSPGTLTFQGDVDLQSGAALNLELSAAASDKLVVAGIVRLGATLHLTALSPLPAATTFSLIDNDGTDAVSGTFAGLPEGAVVTVGGNDFAISYQGGDGNDVVLGPPPPAALAVYVPVAATTFQASW